MNEVPADARRRLLWHGMFLFLIGLVTGVAVPAMTTPRLGLSAHLAGTLDGMFLILLGLFWKDLALGARAAAATFWIQLYAAYAGWLGLLLAALFGTSKSTPIAGAGHVGTDWQELLVNLTLSSFGGAILLGSALVLHGLRRPGKVRGA